MEPTFKTTENIAKKPGLFARPIVQTITGITIILLMLAGLFTYKILSSRIAIDLGMINAPVIIIGPEQTGILDSVYVHGGSTVAVGQAVAQVGSETLYSKISGIVLTVQDVPGQVFSPGQAVVTMIDPTALRVVGTIDENKGLEKISVGQPATFTVDAFGGTQFTGVVEEISTTSKQSGVTFSISDKREVKQFTIKIKYDVLAHPEFKNGMSAKIKVFIKK